MNLTVLPVQYLRLSWFLIHFQEATLSSHYCLCRLSLLHVIICISFLSSLQGHGWNHEVLLPLHFLSLRPPLSSFRIANNPYGSMHNCLDNKTSHRYEFVNCLPWNYQDLWSFWLEILSILNSKIEMTGSPLMLLWSYFSWTQVWNNTTVVTDTQLSWLFINVF